MSTTLFTLLSVGFGAALSAAVARFGANLATVWTGGDEKQLEDSRKWSTRFALIGGGLAACSPVNPFFALLLAIACGAFIAFCLGLLFVGMRVPKDYARLLSVVDVEASQVINLLADPKTQAAIKAEATKVLRVGQEQLNGLTIKKDKTNAQPTMPALSVESADTEVTDFENVAASGVQDASSANPDQASNRRNRAVVKRQHQQ